MRITYLVAPVLLAAAGLARKPTNPPDTDFCLEVSGKDDAQCSKALRTWHDACTGESTEYALERTGNEECQLRTRCLESIPNIGRLPYQWAAYSALETAKQKGSKEGRTWTLTKCPHAY